MRKKMEGTAKKVTKAQVAAVVKQEEVSKSARMKQLFDLGLSVKEIAEAMGVRYNFAYNVVSNYCMQEGIEIEKQKRGGKKEEIIKLYKEGKSNKEIAIELKTNYNYVYNVLKPIKQAEKEAAEAK